ncbi:COG3650 family protein [Sphingomonas japonica]|uniref:Membrane protein n=1 Tax=Sphingomonas japonica TaxID=511662 RepID=A0ABX0U5V2_9SPHN|nr:hypothetical protein [Sphingomonas japonica]NIJ25056.1 putative membrane protein [Sphingomonas japonica]
MRIVLLSIAAFGLAGCQTPPPGQGPPAASYRAIGTDPFWSLAIEGSTMRFEGVGLATLTLPRPEPRTSFNGHRYTTQRMTVDITHGACGDGMSDRVYPDTVAVTVDGRTYNGCGGH